MSANPRERERERERERASARVGTRPAHARRPQGKEQGPSPGPGSLTPAPSWATPVLDSEGSGWCLNLWSLRGCVRRAHSLPRGLLPASSPARGLREDGGPEVRGTGPVSRALGWPAPRLSQHTGLVGCAHPPPSHVCGGHSREHTQGRNPHPRQPRSRNLPRASTGLKHGLPRCPVPLARTDLSS